MTGPIVVVARSCFLGLVFMSSVLRCRARVHSGAEVKHPKDAVAQKECPHNEQRQDPDLRHPSPTESTVPPAHH
jgi:hypothetical protein